MEIKEALQVLGLNDKESAVYMALLQLGRVSAYSIATKSSLKKPTTYVILDELIKKGLVVRIPKEKKQLYIARPPEEAFAVAQEKLDLAKKKLPEILALTKGEATKVSTIYFEGLRGIRQTMEYGFKEMRGKEIVGFYAIAPEDDAELNEYFREWNEKRHSLGIAMRGIAPEHANLKEYRDNDAALSREFKVVPYEQFSSEIAIDATDTAVRIQDYKNLQGIVIENREVTKTVREIFEMAWKNLQ
jgi:sugar-specific transcriptional regulator TrmB